MRPSTAARGLAAALIALPALWISAQAGPDTIGWVEKGKIMPWDVVTKLKMDTGALTSSMHAENIEDFEKDGEDWVRFNVEIEDESTGEQVEKTFERKVLRRVALRGAGGVDHRVSVLMDICLGDTIYQEQFTLKDRDDFNYPVLMGRRAIEHFGAIDVSKTFTTDPVCDADSKTLDHETLKKRSEAGQ